MMSNYVYIIDAGHGGLTEDGKYTTAPNKMHTFPDGFTIYEGVINRLIAERLYHKLWKHNFDFVLIYDDVDDTPLSRRVEWANKVHSKYPNAILISIHSNAGGGKGNEIFTSPGQTKSDVIAEIFCNEYMSRLPQFVFRSDTTDGDHDKEARFAILTQTTCPAILVENLFFDSRDEAEYLNSERGQEEIADVLFRSILKIENTKPI